LGYQYVNPATPYLYVLDADMVMEAGFLEKALAVLESDPELAGVGGKLLDSRVLNSYDRRRAHDAGRFSRSSIVDALGGGGLYRSKAISEVKYLAHRWLPAYEEFELAARLRASNWKLLRLADAAVTHEGHEESDLSMLKRLWKNGRAKSGGMLLRSALFKPWIFSTLRKQAYIFIAPVFYLIVFFLAFYFLDSFLLSIASTAFSSIFLLLFMVYRKKDFQSAVYAFVTWHFFFISSLVGFFSEIRNPAEEISSRVLR
jgi:GT2 family glycosyltransferase